jgi:hypothetical protein
MRRRGVYKQMLHLEMEILKDLKIMSIVPLEQSVS